MIFIESTWKYAELNWVSLLAIFSFLLCQLSSDHFHNLVELFQFKSFRWSWMFIWLDKKTIRKLKNVAKSENMYEMNQVSIFSQINKFVRCEMFRFPLIVPFGYVQRWSALLNCMQVHNMNRRESERSITSNWVDLRLPLKNNYRQHHCTFPHFGKLKCIRFHQSALWFVLVHCCLRSGRVSAHKNAARLLLVEQMRETCAHTQKNAAIKQP